MKAQRGFVALLMIVLIAVGVFGAMAAWVASEPPPSKQAINRVVLAQAKEALLAYVVGTALSGQNTRLPCPSITGDGKADADPIPGGAAKPCGLAGNIQLGLLPWNALSLPPLRDAYGECLWYAVDGQFKNATGLDATLGVNADTDGKITIKDEAGKSLADNVVAVVFARSAEAGLQARSASADGAPPCATTPSGNAAQDASIYLGSANAAPATGPVTSVDLFNATQLAPDKVSLTHQLIWITADEFASVAMRANAEPLATAFRTAVANSVGTNGQYPFAAATPGGTCQHGLYRGFLPASCKYPDPVVGPLSFGLDASSKLAKDRWHELAFYAVAPSCAFDQPECLSDAALIPSKGLVKGALLARGRKLSGQDCGASTGSVATQPLKCIEANNEVFDTSKPGWQSKMLVEPDPALPSNDILKALP
ncbi:hypothetical protein PMI15_00494 [Polaromonas sp. CF318]|uniref:hypothetical protein n=1 Tax=Polaromonas sp. CF318 TaxID=1144318 RepID=UPI0002713C99|nr:hypothetical protein [Polaromonas sp. CF318]EJL89665.1 hypothetical protein PMI15_00494 [Polaromonas sp. CF318]